MNTFYKPVLAVALAACAMAGSAHAALINRGGGMIYDSTLNVTWLADMNYAKTSGYAQANEGGSGSNAVYASGKMGRNAANNWAANLVYGGFDDWRLGTLTLKASPRGEIEHLFIEDLGNQNNSKVSNTDGDTDEQKANLALFSNVFDDYYWSSSFSNPPYGSPAAYSFSADGGVGSDGAIEWHPMYALAVRSGDVFVSPSDNSVPEPATLLLVAGGAVAISATRQRKRLAA